MRNKQQTQLLQLSQVVRNAPPLQFLGLQQLHVPSIHCKYKQKT
jgi:hypothetical protein